MLRICANSADILWENVLKGLVEATPTRTAHTDTDQDNGGAATGAANHDADQDNGVLPPSTPMRISQRVHRVEFRSVQPSCPTAAPRKKYL